MSKVDDIIDDAINKAQEISDAAAAKAQALGDTIREARKAQRAHQMQVTAAAKEIARLKMERGLNPGEPEAQTIAAAAIAKASEVHKIG